ncbi:hypothetical protein H0H93_001835, partial [Arthromyces matolae]
MPSSQRSSKHSAPTTEAQSQPHRSSFHKLVSVLKKGTKSVVQNGKEISGPLAVYVKAGRSIPRLVNPWLDLDSIFIRGLVKEKLLSPDLLPDDGIQGLEDDEEADRRAIEIQERNNTQLNAFSNILKLVPSLKKTMRKLCELSEGEDYYESLIHELVLAFGKGVSGARAEDTRKAKDGIIWIMQNSDLFVIRLGAMTLPLPVDKSARGFNNKHTAFLLTP